MTKTGSSCIGRKTGAVFLAQAQLSPVITDYGQIVHLAFLGAAFRFQLLPLHCGFRINGDVSIERSDH